MGTEIKQSLETDFYLMDELLTEEERRIRDKVREFCDNEVIPIINDYWERAEFPFELIPKIAKLRIAGGSISGYGCPGMSHVAAGLVALEFARGDAPGEPVFVPRTADAPEGDGWLLSVVYRGADDRSDLAVFDATDVAKGPVGVAQLPRRVPYGFHGNWRPAA